MRNSCRTYLEGAVRVFRWGEHLLCQDGGFYNDAQSSWRGITVFQAMALYETLEKHGRILEDRERRAMEDRLARAGEWVYKNIVPGYPTNLNYFAAGAALLALLGGKYGKTQYTRQAETLFCLCRQQVGVSGLLCGEGGSIGGQDSRGNRPVDIGYNVDESLPSLLLYSRAMQDTEALEWVERQMENHLLFVLPDGGIDNSFGTRNYKYKWSYWGSRTTDGCQWGYGLWGTDKPLFLEAAYRNVQLLRQCTRNGLLYGGPDYADHGEDACIHHTFCHAKGLAAVPDYGVESWEAQKLPTEKETGIFYYPEVHTFRVQTGGFLADVTGYGWESGQGGHTMGGTISLLWHPSYGPVVAAGMVEYWLTETADMRAEGRNRIRVVTGLADKEGNVLRAENGRETRIELDYLFERDAVRIKGRVQEKEGLQGRWVLSLPVIRPGGKQFQGELEVRIQAGPLLGKREIFNLSPGFQAQEIQGEIDTEDIKGEWCCLKIL